MEGEGKLHAKSRREDEAPLPAVAARFDGPVPAGGWKRGACRIRSLGNLMTMGHCAPTVMKTVLDKMNVEGEWLVKLAAGMPGGIGDTGSECGGITSPLILLGLRYGRNTMFQGLPLVFYKGHDHVRNFLDRNGSLLCREIRGERLRLWPCVKAVCTSPEILSDVVSRESGGAIPDEAKDAYRRLYAHLKEKDFHCCQAVLGHLDHAIPVGPELLDGTVGFMGGTLMTGRTCGALAGGIMALGLRNAEIERNPLRVLRMIALMLAKGDAFADKINKFNVIMNEGNGLAKWFTGEFGSTQCRSITGADFSSRDGVADYVRRDVAAECRDIAGRVAEKVASIFEASS
jgi:C_GCAxxG_C_C family probable redox protein